MRPGGGGFPTFPLFPLFPHFPHFPHFPPFPPLPPPPSQVNTVSAERGGAGHRVATACGDATVCVWDARALGARPAAAAPLLSLRHGKSCQSAYFSPAGAPRLLVTSYDDTVAVWSAAADSPPAPPPARPAVSVRHDNQTGRWLLPLRAVWTPGGDAFVVGSMKRETEVFSAATGARVAAHAHPSLLTAVPSRHAVHPGRAGAVAAGTASGRAHIWLADD